MKRIFNLLLFSILPVFTFLSCTEVDFSDFSFSRSERRILVDASHDGGVWWFPQSGVYSPSAPHQGKAFADLLKARGFKVDELASNTLITDSILSQYDKVIRAGDYSNYLPSELQAYDRFLAKKSSLFLISEFHQPGETDLLAERLGIIFKGTHYGYIDTYAPHSITNGAPPFYFNAGSVVSNLSSNPGINILGWLSGNTNLPVMGIVQHPDSRIFFLGDLNGLEGLPQPLTDNIIKWLFE